MRTTYGSPLFADHVPEHDSLLVERLRAAGAIVIGKTNTPEFGAGSQTFNAVFGRDAQPVRPHARRPAARAAARRRPSRPGCCRSPTAPTSARASATPRRSATSSGCAPPRAGSPTPGPATRGTRSRSSGRSPARRADVALLLARARRPRPARSALDPGAVRRPDLDGDPRGLRIAWSRDLGGLPVDPEVTARAGARARDARRPSAASSRTPSPTSAAPTSASRCCAA